MTRTGRSIVAALIAFAPLLGCSRASTEPLDAGDADASFVRDEDALFQTDSQSYIVTVDDQGYRGEIGVRFTNRTGRTVYFVNCHGTTGHTLEKLVDGKWETAWSPVMLLCLSPPITVPAGGTYDSRLQLYAGPPGSNAYPQFSSNDVEGTYRVVWHAALHSYSPDRHPFGEALPLAQRVSNRFTISVRRR